MSACPVCGGKTAAAALPGLLTCADCGLTYSTEKHMPVPVYAPGLEQDIYVSAKTKLFKTALDWLDSVRLPPRLQRDGRTSMSANTAFLPSRGREPRRSMSSPSSAKSPIPRLGHIRRGQTNPA